MRLRVLGLVLLLACLVASVAGGSLPGIGDFPGEQIFPSSSPALASNALTARLEPTQRPPLAQRTEPAVAGSIAIPSTPAVFRRFTSRIVRPSVRRPSDSSSPSSPPDDH